MDASARGGLQKKHKVCLTGDGGVGKTSLIRRFVYDAFDDRYVTTLGAKVTKKVHDVEMPDTGETRRVALMIWDIMGQRGIRDLLREAYFTRAQGALLVCDVTRPQTLEGLDGWRQALKETTGPVPLYLLGNKADLRRKAKVGEEDLKAVADAWGCPYALTSAKTGGGVEQAFEALTHMILARSGPDED